MRDPVFIGKGKRPIVFLFWSHIMLKLLTCRKTVTDNSSGTKPCPGPTVANTKHHAGRHSNMLRNVNTINNTAFKRFFGHPTVHTCQPLKVSPIINIINARFKEPYLFFILDGKYIKTTNSNSPVLSEKTFKRNSRTTT